MSSYVPSWVKRDTARFPRAHLATGPIQHISPFGEAIVESDGSAFARFLAYLRDSGRAEPVPFVQVENEVGLLGGPRDLSSLAQERWQDDVPAALIEAVAAGNGRLRTAWQAKGEPSDGSWAEVFGAEGDEAFMAAAYASHVETVASRGRAEFDIPLFVNAWLDGAASGQGAAVAGGAEPGTYPSGGPLPHMFPIWQTLAPTIDFISPDIYFGDFDQVCSDYRTASGLLFIPEMRRDEVGIAQMFRALGAHGATGVSPFGLDSLRPGAPTYDEYVDAYALLRAIVPDLRSATEDRIAGFSLDDTNPAERLRFGDIELIVDINDPRGLLGEGTTGHGIVIALPEGGFRIAGRGFLLTLAGIDDHVGFDSVVELDTTLTPVRVLNGDETGGGDGLRFHRLYHGLGQGLVPFDTRFTGLADIHVYRY
jgi:hypothetical protein